MRLRIKFTKTGPQRYISHLDTMRFFQKALRRAEVDVAMSEGFSPHMLMSFALPLSLGMTSVGEYFDLDVRSLDSTEELKRRLGEQTGRDVKILSVKAIAEDKANKCMTQVEAADYTVWPVQSDGSVYDTADEGFRKRIDDFMSRPEILFVKRTKKTESELNIRPLIFSFTADEAGMHLRLKAGSRDHVKCAAVMEKFSEITGFVPASYEIRRDELLLLQNGAFIPLSGIGRTIP